MYESDNNITNIDNSINFDSYSNGVNIQLIKDQKQARLKIFLKMVIVLLAVLLLLTYCTYRPDRSVGGFFPYDPDIVNGLIPGLSQEEKDKLLQETVDASMFGFQIEAEPVFENGQSKGNLSIGNPPSNKYYIIVEIVLDSTSEILYKSGLIPPNSHIPEISLAKNLPKGRHKATANISVYDNEEPTKLVGSSAAVINININN